MLFQQIVKTLEISVKMIHSEPGKFKNYRLPLKPTQRLGVTLSGEEIQIKSDINERNIANYC